MTIAELREIIANLPDDMVVAAYSWQLDWRPAAATIESEEIFNDGRPYLWIEGVWSEGQM